MKSVVSFEVVIIAYANTYMLCMWEMYTSVSDVIAVLACGAIRLCSEAPTAATVATEALLLHALVHSLAVRCVLLL